MVTFFQMIQKIVIPINLPFFYNVFFFQKVKTLFVRPLEIIMYVPSNYVINIHEPWEEEKTLYRHMYIPYIYLYVYNIECSKFIWLEHILVMFDVIFHVCVCVLVVSCEQLVFGVHPHGTYWNSYMMQIMMMWCHIRGYNVLFSL